MDIFNSLPYISKNHKNLFAAFNEVHEILCQKNCHKNRHKSAFEKLMLPFLLRMSALSDKNNDCLIYHAEKVKLNNFNFSGIFEYLQDEVALQNNEIKLIFDKIHNEIKLRKDFKELYLRNILSFAITNEYKSVDLLLITIMTNLFEDYLFEFDNVSRSFSQNSSFSNESFDHFSSPSKIFNEQNFPSKYRKNFTSEVKSFLNFNDREKERIQKKNLKKLSMIYNFDFHEKFQRFIYRENEYLSIYSRILLTLRFQAPYFYNYIVSVSQYPIFINFAFRSSLNDHLNITNKIMKFIIEFPDNFSKEIESCGIECSFFSKGSVHLSEEKIEIQPESILQKIIEINSFLRIKKNYENSGLQIESLNIENKSETMLREPKEIFESTDHQLKFDFFIDLIYFHMDKPKIIRSALNFLSRIIKNEFNLNLLYVLLKIYKILEIYEPFIDEISKNALTHIDFTVNCYEKLASVSHDVYKFFFSAAFNCISEKTIEYEINLNNIPDSKKNLL